MNAQIQIKLYRTRVALSALCALSLLAINTEASAKLHPASECKTTVSDLTINGQPLTYEAIAKAPRTRVASNGTVYAPVKLPNGREAIYAVERNGCARKTNLLIGALR